jgi:nitroreductase
MFQCISEPMAEPEIVMAIPSPSMDAIRKRFSCRTYIDEPLTEQERQVLEEAVASLATGPFGTLVRFRLVAATSQERDSLRGLGTYGFIRGATGFIVGAVSAGEKDLEDYGCTMESLVLLATELGLGTCWLGGSFRRSSFARRIVPAPGEQMPAVVAIGHIADPVLVRSGFIRRQIKADVRLPWARLFFDGQFGRPLAREAAGDFAEALEMVRLGPSASNRQPWRVVRARGAWHFYLSRAPGYWTMPVVRLLGISDMQRVEMGIAMCHFSLACREIGLSGAWEVRSPAVGSLEAHTEYTASWVS